MVPKNNNEKIDSIKERAKAKLERDFGPDLFARLNDPKTAEIMVNPDGKVFQEKQSGETEYVGTIRPAQAQAIIETVAALHGEEATKDNSLIEGELPFNGERFAGQLPPSVDNPSFTIRKRAIEIFTLHQYVEANIMTEGQREALRQAITNRNNILVIGGCSSGKTTLINAIINEQVDIFPNERPIIIEDTKEIQCAAKNYVQLKASKRNGTTMQRLLQATLRMNPKKILVGEVRGKEALDLLDAWNTGHPGGCATLHADSAQLGLIRLKSLVSRNREEAPAEIEPLIADAVHVVVFIEKTKKEGRKVKEILRVKGFRDNNYILESI